jgi:hypothetical protein
MASVMRTPDRHQLKHALAESTSAPLPLGAGNILFVGLQTPAKVVFLVKRGPASFSLHGFRAASPQTISTVRPFRCASLRCLAGGQDEHVRAGSKVPRRTEFPRGSELRGMSRQQLADLTLTKIAWQARGGLDGLQLFLNDGRVSPFFGACAADGRCTCIHR